MTRPNAADRQTFPGGLSQKEVAAVLKMSERGVRDLEKRALRKLQAHPVLRTLWGELAGHDVQESNSALTSIELMALIALARSFFERTTLAKVIGLAYLL